MVKAGNNRRPDVSLKGKDAKKTTAVTASASAAEAVAKASVVFAADAAVTASDGATRSTSEHPKRKELFLRGSQPPTSSQTETILVGGLPTELSEIYKRTVAAFAPAYRSMRAPQVLRSPDNAVLMFQVDSRKEAKSLWKRLEKTVVYGRKWRPTFAPLAAVTPSSSPTVVHVTLTPPGLDPLQVDAILGTMPGFLAATLSDAAYSFLATFADEGSALHARAVLSGRRQEGGVHMFLTLVRTDDADAASISSESESAA